MHVASSLHNLETLLDQSSRIFMHNTLEETFSTGHLHIGMHICRTHRHQCHFTPCHNIPGSITLGRGGLGGASSYGDLLPDLSGPSARGVDGRSSRAKEIGFKGVLGSGWEGGDVGPP